MTDAQKCLITFVKVLNQLSIDPGHLIICLSIIHQGSLCVAQQCEVTEVSA